MEDHPAENPVGYSVIMTVAGVLLATVLVAVIGATLFMWAETDRTDATAVEVEAQTAAEAQNEAEGEIAAAEADAEGAAEEGGGEAAESEAEAEAAAEDDGAAEAAPEADAAGASDMVAAAFQKGACIGCHVIPGVPNANGVIGPNLTNIGAVAATRVAGQSAQEYLHTSLVAPDDFIAPDCPTGPCPAGVMLPSYSQMLSEEELNAVVDYLLTLQGE